MQGILKSLRPAVAMIFTAGLKILIPAVFENGIPSLATGSFHPRIALYFVVSLVVLRLTRLGPIKVMLGCGAAEVLVQLVLSAL